MTAIRRRTAVAGPLSAALLALAALVGCGGTPATSAGTPPRRQHSADRQRPGAMPGSSGARVAHTPGITRP